MEDNKLFQIFVKLLDGKTATLRFTTPHAYGDEIKRRIFEITKIPIHSQRLISGGTQLRDNSVVSSPKCTVNLVLRLLGGKGGFGSLLRGAATKAGQKKTNNFDACRDMSGRRLRHVNAEKRLEEWKAEEDERRLETIAEDFIKKKSKKGKKGIGDGEAEKYVQKYREESAKCAAQVERAIREACADGNGKRKGKVPADTAEAKRLKIWMGKRKLADSDSESMDEESSDVENYEESEKSVVLNNGNHSDLNNETERSSDSVTAGKQGGQCCGGGSLESGSGEEKEANVDHSVKSSPGEELFPHEKDGEVDPVIHEEIVDQNPSGTCLEAAGISGVEALKAEPQQSIGPDSQSLHVSGLVDGEVIESRSLISEANGFHNSDSKCEGHEEIIVANVKNTDLEKQLNFDEISSAAELEILGMERLKTELQTRGLKCGGTLQERAARLFMLKSTPLDKLPKKLLAKK